jgi:hypothetical protein
MFLVDSLLNVGPQISTHGSQGEIGFHHFKSLIFHPFKLCLLSSQHQAAQITQILSSLCASIALGESM